MSYANGTAHFNLPQTVGSDKRDWFDTNKPFSDVDEALWGAKQSAESAASQVTTLGQRVGDVENDVVDIKQDITTLDGNVSGLQTAVTNLGTRVDDLKSDIKDAICSINEPDATADYRHEIGTFFWYNDTLYIATQLITAGQQIVPNTNCNTTNVTTQILQAKEGTDWEYYFLSTPYSMPSGSGTFTIPTVARGHKEIELIVILGTMGESKQLVVVSEDYCDGWSFVQTEQYFARASFNRSGNSVSVNTTYGSGYGSGTAQIRGVRYR